MRDLSAKPASSIEQTVHAAIAGLRAVKLIDASVLLFQAGGNRVLTESAKHVLRKAAEGSAARVMTTAAEVLGPSVAASAKQLAQTSAKQAAAAVGKEAAKAAGREILKGAGKAVGVGFVVDGAIASVEAIRAYRAGTMTRKAAIRHVATEAATGAIATGAGVALGVAFVALTGGIAAPVIFGVAAAGTISAKRALRTRLA
jgi:hypothetical protein